jgi:hypothetical protein
MGKAYDRAIICFSMIQLQNPKFVFDGDVDSTQFSSLFIYELSSTTNGQLQNHNE